MPCPALMVSPDADHSEAFRDAVRSAYGEGTQLYLDGGGSKRERFGRACEAHSLSVAGHRGIISYRPDELVLTARAGTPLDELVEAAAEHGQILAFEAPGFEGRATLGGTLACNCAGPSRPWRGAPRDAVLGLRLIDGRGRLLRFGGEVIKNVAGYDVSRLQAGALGTLGLISEVSLRLLPRPAARLVLRRDCPREEAVTELRELAAHPYPLTGACWYANRLYLRLEGEAAALTALRRRLDGYAESDEDFWSALREWRLPELAGAQPLWMLDLAAATAPQAMAGTFLIDWAGARRWMPGASGDVGSVGALAASCGGVVQGIWGGARNGDVIATPPEPLRTLLKRLKATMDPGGVFNPGRLHAWM